MHWLNIAVFENPLSRCQYAVGPCVIRPVDLETLDVGPSIFPFHEDVDKCEFSPMQDGSMMSNKLGWWSKVGLSDVSLSGGIPLVHLHL